VVVEVKTRLRELCLKHYESILLYLDLTDPAVGFMAQEFEKLGCFFAGILPGAHGGEALILQYLNNVAIDSSKIQLYSEMSRETLEYIIKTEPTQFLF